MEEVLLRIASDTEEGARLVTGRTRKDGLGRRGPAREGRGFPKRRWETSAGRDARAHGGAHRCYIGEPTNQEWSR